jgi:hypothetical protein
MGCGLPDRSLNRLRFFFEKVKIISAWVDEGLDANKYVACLYFMEPSDPELKRSDALVKIHRTRPGRFRGSVGSLLRPLFGSPRSDTLTHGFAGISRRLEWGCPI